MRRSILAAFLLFSIIALSFGTVPLSNLNDATFYFCFGLKALLPALSMLMVLAAATIYALGQLSGAETRARANVWATAAITGALVGMLIVTIAPPILGMLYGGSVDCEVFVL